MSNPYGRRVYLSKNISVCGIETERHQHSCNGETFVSNPISNEIPRAVSPNAINGDQIPE